MSIPLLCILTGTIISAEGNRLLGRHPEAEHYQGWSGLVSTVPDAEVSA